MHYNYAGAWCLRFSVLGSQARAQVGKQSPQQAGLAVSVRCAAHCAAGEIFLEYPAVTIKQL